ncbi:hypothetical protein [Actinacidiphila reveromycinica]|nr:hypothetical protein [Streptomyces sp. SN-593]
MGLFSKNNDQQFYDQRASEVQDAVARGDIDAAARLVAGAVIEEGTAALTHLTTAVERNNRKD